MAKKRKSISPTRKRPRETSSEPDLLYYSTYEITSEPMEDAAYRRLPSVVKKQLDLLHALAQTRPNEAIPALLGIRKLYPSLPLVYNYLSVAYSHAGDKEKMEEAIRENYQRNPNYLFARLNYAEIYLVKRDYAQVAAILDNKFDLKLLYPQRKRFHVSEFTGFMGIVGLYFHGIGDRESAEQAYTALTQVAPDHQITRRLHAKLYPNVLRRLFNRLPR